VKIHQIYVAAVPGDAIGNQMLEIDARLRAWGLEATIFAQYVAPELADHVRPDYEYLPYLHAPEDLLLYHYGLHTPNVRYFQATRGRRVLMYHNITPAHFFRGWSRELELLCDVGRRTLSSLTDCDLALGDSDHNRQELVAAGFPEEKTGVVPLFSQQSQFEALPIDQGLLKQLRAEGMVNWLTVGRVAPHKAIEDVIRTFYAYHRAINRHSRLYVVGLRYLPAYDAALDALVAELGLGDAVQFTGVALGARLKTYYQAADLYLCTSYHEGLCVPLVESMYFGLPILARKAAAIPETLGNAGVLFTRLGHTEVAEMANLLLTDQGLRTQVIARQRERLQDLAPSRVEAQLRQVLAPLGIMPAAGQQAHSR
jgi:glycosyltransferase involved in cell wall biosynthesis